MVLVSRYTKEELHFIFGYQFRYNGALWVSCYKSLISLVPSSVKYNFVAIDIIGHVLNQSKTKLEQ
jgi:hypothetical protein